MPLVSRKRKRIIGFKRNRETMKKTIDLSRKKMKNEQNSLEEIDSSKLKISSVALSSAICQICNELDSEATSEEKILVHCKGRGCTFEAHVGCLKKASSISWEWDENIALTFRCTNCKRCCVCWKKKAAEAEARSVTCLGCQRQFHMCCHFPKVIVKKSDWNCTNCSAGKPKELKIDFSLRKSARAPKRKLEENLGTGRNLKSDLQLNFSDSVSKTQPSKIPELSRFQTDEVFGKTRKTKTEPEISNLPRRTEESSVQTRKKKSVKEKSRTDIFVTDLKQSYTDLWVSTSDVAFPTDPPESEKERPVTPEAITSPRFISVLKNHQKKLNEESEIRQIFSLWTVEQCAAYFADSFPEMSELILKHDLFGSSLMIISRSQFSQLFGLPLGKTLLFYNAVCKWRGRAF